MRAVFGAGSYFVVIRKQDHVVGNRVNGRMCLERSRRKRLKTGVLGGCKSGVLSLSLGERNGEDAASIKEKQSQSATYGLCSELKRDIFSFKSFGPKSEKGLPYFAPHL